MKKKDHKTKNDLKSSGQMCSFITETVLLDSKTLVSISPINLVSPINKASIKNYLFKKLNYEQKQLSQLDEKTAENAYLCAAFFQKHFSKPKSHCMIETYDQKTYFDQKTLLTLLSFAFSSKRRLNK